MLNHIEMESLGVMSRRKEPASGDGSQASALGSNGGIGSVIFLQHVGRPVVHAGQVPQELRGGAQHRPHGGSFDPTILEDMVHQEGEQGAHGHLRDHPCIYG